MKEIILIILLFSLTSCAKQKHEVTVWIKKEKNSLRYNISNTGSSSIFIPHEYYAKVSGDSVIFEGIYKPTESEVAPLYNSFIPPKMFMLRSGTVSEIFTLTDNFQDNITKYYFRIYTQSFENYLNKINYQYNPHLKEFLSYENKSSYLVKAEIRDHDSGISE